MLYFLHGGSEAEPGLGVATVAQSRPSIRLVLLTFARLAKHAVTTYPDAPSQTFSKQSKVPHLRARTLGYTNHMPCITGIPLLVAQEQFEIAKRIVAMRH